MYFIASSCSAWSPLGRTGQREIDSRAEHRRAERSPAPGARVLELPREPEQREDRQRERGDGDGEHHDERHAEREEGGPQLGWHEGRQRDAAHRQPAERGGRSEAAGGAPCERALGRQVGQVPGERVELGLIAGRVGRVHACRELGVGQPARGVMALDELDDRLAVGVGDAHVWGEEEHGGGSFAWSDRPAGRGARRPGGWLWRAAPRGGAGRKKGGIWSTWEGQGRRSWAKGHHKFRLLKWTWA